MQLPDPFPHQWIESSSKCVLQQRHLGYESDSEPDPWTLALTLTLTEFWTFRSQDHSLPGAKVPGVELSLPGTFAPTNKM